MKKQSKYRCAHTAVGASGLALIMGLVNVAVAADVTVAVNPNPAHANDIVVTSDAAHPSSASQFFYSPVSADIEGSSFMDINTGNGVIVTPGNTLSASAGGNKAQAETTVESYTDLGDFSISSAQVSVLDDSDSFANASLGSELVTIQFSAPLTRAVVSGNIANADATVNKSVAYIKQDGLEFADAVTASAVKATAVGFSTPTTGHSAIDVTANGVIANYQLTDNNGDVARSGASVTDAAIRVAATSSAGLLDDESAIAISDNRVNAVYGANNASSQYEGSGIDVEGSMAMANYQINNSTSSSDPMPTASIVGSGVTVDLDTNRIEGDVTITKQKILADSNGNAATNRMSIDVAHSVSGGPGGATASVNASAAGLSASASNATVAIANAQRNHGAHLESSISDSDITVNGMGGDGAITVSDNESRASATGNTANNSLLTKAGTIEQAGAVVANAQVNRDTTILAANSSNIGVTSPEGVPTYGLSTHAGPVVFSDNHVSAFAMGNTAGNYNKVGSDTNIDSGTAIITNSNQYSTGGGVTAETASNIGATQLLGEFTVAVPWPLSIFIGPTITVADGSESVDMLLAGNTIESIAKVNFAANTTLVEAGSGEHSGSITNQQFSDTSSNATAHGTLGVGLFNVDTDSDVALTLRNNTISASASGNVAANEFINNATTTLGGGGASSLSNAQTSEGAISANAGTSANPLELAITGIGHVGGATDILGNELQSVAVANSAENTVALKAGTALDVTVPTGEVSLNSNQTSSSSLVSSTDGSILINAEGIAIPLPGLSDVLPARISGDANVVGNKMLAIGVQNDAVNAVALAAGTTADANASLSNTQTSSSSTDVSVISDGVGLRTAGSGGDVQGAAVVTDNVLESQAAANQAHNALSIVSGTGSAATGTLMNTQTNEVAGAVTATTMLNGKTGITASGSLTGSTVTVGANRAASLAYGNSAINVLNADGGAGALAGNLVSTNMQSNAGPISSAVRDGASSFGTAMGITTGYSGGYTANVLGNTVSSQAYGNHVQNALNASSMGGMAGSASTQLISSQTNTGAVSAHVSNAGVGMVGMATGAGAGRSVIAGNTISAMAVGNSSVSQMVIGR